MSPRRCGRCGAHYEGAAFADLPPVRTLDGPSLSGCVVHWPEGAVVEVRTCRRCRAPIAALRRAS